eukprot:CAMPEP_0194313558 /NCGR_PEP_ID=MMETSP0171-20130528/10428_1 /TAXON_ID=218684 /ORGANISM="Corethron pennatum, Strain L29A3" /LENGTH=312 /DNA_ID=CAMNT_0039068573 /DNA_START=198 /DNA_END=1136 /DNA_ORIENTATION=-
MKNEKNTESAPNVPAESMDPPVLDNRPPIVVDALVNDKPIYYFGVGSNLSREKLENRAICGKKIKPLSMEAAVVEGHRLAFNMRAFPPLEPSMGSLEPAEGGDLTAAYPGNECHGALILLSAGDYDRVMRSEGVGATFYGSDPERGYEEIVVKAQPYGGGAPVNAVSLRLKIKSRMPRDLCPSLRYMDLIRSGAKELGLAEPYQKWLDEHHVQRSPKIIQKLAVYNICATSVHSVGRKNSLIKFYSLARQKMLLAVFVSSTNSSTTVQLLSNFAMGIIFFPGSMIGYFLMATRKWTGFTLPPMLEKMLEKYK